MKFLVMVMFLFNPSFLHASQITRRLFLRQGIACPLVLAFKAADGLKKEENSNQLRIGSSQDRSILGLEVLARSLHDLLREVHSHSLVDTAA